MKDWDVFSAMPSDVRGLVAFGPVWPNVYNLKRLCPKSNYQSVQRTNERYRTASGSERDKDSTSKVAYLQEHFA
jgi:hypothetical protein